MFRDKKYRISYVMSNQGRILVSRLHGISQCFVSVCFFLEAYCVGCVISLVVWGYTKCSH